MNDNIIYDGHCHLDSVANADSSQRLALAAISEDDWLKLVKLRTANSLYKVGFGLHPWYVTNLDDDDKIEQFALRLENAIKQYQPDFLGETGLDWLKSNFELQTKILHIHLKLAQKYNLPVVMHCVKAYSPLLHSISLYPIKGLLHGFNANSQIAQQLWHKNITLGIGSLILQNNSQLNKSAIDIPLEQIIIETDAPYMPPANQIISTPQNCLIYAQKVAQLKQKNLDEIIIKVNQNWLELF